MLITRTSHHLESDFTRRENPLQEWFAAYITGPGVHKRSGYLDAYHRHFNNFRYQDKVTFVEVGVQSGGSIEMWRSYFGADKLK